MEKNKRIIVVGGVAGGMSFATRYKRLYPQHEVLVFDKGPYVSFANCGLPYALSDIISSRSKLIVETKERLGARFEIDVFTETEVTKVDAVNKQVTVVSRGKERVFSYDELVLSPGAKPIMIPIKGLADTDVFGLRHIPDLDAIKSRLEQKEQNHVLVIGAGYIGLEVAENLRHKGHDVTIVEKAPHILPTFDREIAAFAHKELLDNGVTVYANDEVVEVKERVAYLKSGAHVAFDLVIMSIGVMTDTSFLAGSGVALSSRGAILVDEHYETNVKHIFAVGDAILVKHEITGELVSIALASPANRQGRQLADHLGGLKTSNRGSLGTAILKLFERSFASTGLNERQVKALNVPYKKIYVLWFDHATYYPGATSIHLKVVFNPETGLLYGAQALGKKGVDKRIDILATAIKAKMPITMFPELEFTYAPPFGLAKDIVNLAGYHASNVLNGISDLVEWDELDQKMNEGAILVDVRSERERIKHGYIQGSINIPIEEFRDRFEELPIDKEIVLYCESGTRSYNAERILKSFGYRAFNLNGSFAFYRVGRPEKVVSHE